MPGVCRIILSALHQGQNLFKKEIECSYFIHHMSPLWGYKELVESLDPSSGELNVTPAPSIGRVYENGAKTYVCVCVTSRALHTQTRH